MNRRCLVLMLILAWMPGMAQAVLTIEITGGAERALPIAVVPFGWNGSGDPPEDIAAIIGNNLRLSGRFEPVPRDELVADPTTRDEVNFRDWRALGSQGLVVGQLQHEGGDRYTLRVELLDVFRGERLVGYSIPARGDQLRWRAHEASDRIYNELTGHRGAFATRIAFVSVSEEERDGEVEATYQLQIADADGHDPASILTSEAPLLSPAWSPDARRIAYVSYENNRPEVFVQSLYGDGERQRIAGETGISSAPAWSPDGSSLALSLSRDGRPEIYVVDLDNGEFRRLTDNRSIDTEPTYSPDGDSIYFTSDRGGRAQIYRIPAEGGNAERVTYDGVYNASPAISPDGTQLATVSGRDRGYRIAVFDLERGRSRVVSDSSNDESPTFAPNGALLMYATKAEGEEVLALTSVDGQVRQRITSDVGQIREPAWAPFED